MKTEDWLLMLAGLALFLWWVHLAVRRWDDEEVKP